ncbi:YSIRK signal domain/LPXTG anchor domain surface protein [Streptococcus agalactiae]|uniref:Gram-positive cocci surface proteins LPxTG domain-containing protein n=1 Tax=Streptococcus agalactiae TaxID=1311 RepID=A0A837KX26_STRAG|nr:YSIRK signal domain/LPXTG anchor domain surface protein [Streptococcus agalactiae]EPT44333.1 hypothetical protein SAG0029_09915 [Streptococcus agalactiae FSL S3-501]EPV90848.1 hypothetical protein SAG0023_08530 [Streptococcus agalactiae FSL S3-105]KLL35181.1 hypothetical protein WA03_05040 [Streptococcus agalactiae]KLL35408.1 hypothetical protein WA04_10750 [Streptococcus agalactiae]
MNNNEKKVKYFLRKTAYGLASMSAAFIVCSGIVNTPTVSADSSNTLKVEKLGGIKNVESVHTLKPVSIPQELEAAKNKARSEIISHPNILDPSVANLAKDYFIKIYQSNDVSEVNRLLAEFYNALVKQNLDVNPEDYSSKIDDISTTGLAIALEAKEIYEANKSILPHRYKDSVGTYVNSFEERRSPGKFNIWNGQEGFNAAQKLLEDVKKLLLELQNLTKNNKPNIQVPKQAPTEAAKPVLSPEALTRLTTWYNQAKDLLKDDQVKDKYVDILAVQKAVDQAYDHVEEGKFITTDQANQLANKLRDALQSLELKDKKVAKPEAKPEVKPEVKPDVKPEAKPEVKPDVKPEAKPEVKPDVKPEAKPEAKPATKKSVNTSGNLAAKKAIENKKYSKKLPSTGEAASPLLAIVSLIVMLSAGLITIVLKHKKN